MCQVLPDPANGTVSYSSATPERDGFFAFDVVASYSCDTGFALVGGMTRICIGEGSSVGAFDGVTPTCEGNESMVFYSLEDPTMILPDTFN